MKLHEFFLAQSPDAILLIQPDGIIVNANAEASKLFGYSEEELTGKPLLVLIPERYHVMHSTLLERFLVSGESARKMDDFQDISIITKNGSEFSVEIAIGKGELEGETLLIAIIRNPVDKKDTEAILRSMALFPLENPNPVIRIQLDGKVLFTNAEGRKLIEMTGQAKAEYAPPDWVEDAQQAFKSAGQIDEIRHYQGRAFSVVFAPIIDMKYVNVYALDITEREKTNNELELSDQILKSIGNLVLVANGEGTVVYISQSVKDILGYETHEVLGSGWWEIERNSGGDIEAEQAYVRKAARGEVTVDGKPYEHRVKHKDGSWRWLMLADAKGPRDLLIGIGTDITNLKLIESELQDQRDFAVTLMENMGQGLAVTDTNSKFNYVNPALAHMLGYEPDQLLGKTSLDILLPVSHEVARKNRQLREQGQATVFEAQVRRSDGGNVTALVTGVPRIVDGKFMGTITVTTDLTERLAMEAVIRQSEESMRSLYIISSSQEHFYKKINKLLKMGIERFGLENGILSNIVDEVYTVIAAETPEGQLFPGTVYELSETYCSKTSQSDEPIGFMHASMSEWETHPCFQRTQLEAYIGTQVMVSGRVYGTLNFSSSTPRERKFTPADKEFLKLMSLWVGTELERLESTNQLEGYASEIAQNNKELAIARDRALEASRLKSGFLATMSHEIRTPMNAIIGMNEILLESELSEEQREFAGIVGTSAQALLTIINDILDFSKIEAGKLIIHPEAFDVQKLTREIVDMFQHKAAEKGLALEVQLDEYLPHTLFGDVGRIRQVLINLVGNAMKFTEKGSISLRVSGTLIQGIAHIVTFAVQDTGMGIPEWLQPLLFESFTQANESATRKHGGTGLGLAISRRLVELMSGEIGFESKEGQGSAFWFSLPLGHKPLGSPQLRDLAKAKGGLPDSSSPSAALVITKPVLIVEDDETNRALLTAQLRQLGLPSFAVSSGKDAIELLTIRPHDFCLTLMDLGMPDIDGLSTTRIIRQHETKTGKHSIIIANTASAIVGNREACLESGMDDFIAKPAMLDTINEVLQKWL